MDLNPYIKEIHETAKAKGWWDSPRDDASLYALFHSEISEAVEEMRKPALEDDRGQGMYHWKTTYDPSSGDADGVKKIAVAWVEIDEETGKVLTKPEGIGVEIIDAVIRVLDYLGYKGRSVTTTLDRFVFREGDMKNLAPFSFMHRELSHALSMNEDGDHVDEVETLERFLSYAYSYCEERGWYFKAILETKMAYNGTRSYRHGNKKF